MPPTTTAALISLGDQPQIQASTVTEILREFTLSSQPLIVPSFDNHRGHPWLIARQLWDDLLATCHPASPRDFLNKHADLIRYVEAQSASILKDVDTPIDYEREKHG